MHKTIFPLAALMACLPAFAQVDLSGTWADRITEDSDEGVPGGPPLQATIRAFRSMTPGG